MNNSLPIGQILTQSWEIFKKNWPALIVVGLCMMFLSVFFQCARLIELAPKETQAVLIIAYCAAIIPLMFAYLWLELGAIRMMLSMARGTFTSFTFDYWRLPLSTYFKSLGAGIIVSFFVFLILMVVLVPTILMLVGLSKSAGNIGLVFAVIIGIAIYVAFLVFALIYGTRIGFYNQLLLDNPELGCVESISQSFRITKPQMWMLVLLNVIASLIASAGFMLCCVGLIATQPFGTLIPAIAYTYLTGERDKASEETVTETVTETVSETAAATTSESTTENL